MSASHRELTGGRRQPPGEGHHTPTQGSETRSVSGILVVHRQMTSPAEDDGSLRIVFSCRGHVPPEQVMDDAFVFRAIHRREAPRTMMSPVHDIDGVSAPHLISKPPSLPPTATCPRLDVGAFDGLLSRRTHSSWYSWETPWQWPRLLQASRQYPSRSATWARTASITKASRRLRLAILGEEAIIARTLLCARQANPVRGVPLQ